MAYAEDTQVLLVVVLNILQYNQILLFICRIIMHVKL